jgi:2,3-bisphosphoglycerate-independent phosphoglycerate mutase
MDRDKRWERVELAYNAIVCGEGEHESDPAAAVERSYASGITDEFIKPIICDEEGLVRSDDSIIFINFRPDRAREITRAFVDPDFDGFVRKNGYFPVKYVCTTQYDETLPNVSIAYPPETLENTFGQVISAAGLTQLRIAETEKYAHVTFFFNGGAERVYDGEDRILVNSPKEFATYDLIPQMSAYELTEKAVLAIESGKYDVMVLNFANCDMVGHTGIMDAAVSAVQAVDECVGKVTDAVLATGGTAVITADHGNAEEMLDEDGVTPHTAHSTNPVPFIVVGRDVSLRSGGRLCDIAPTLLELMGIVQPKDMTGTSLIEK